LPKIGKYLAAADGNSLNSQLKADGQLSFEVDGQPVVLSPDDVLIETDRMEGFYAVSDRDATVVISTALSADLIHEGFVREIVSKVQTMRKEAGFEVTDRIQLYYTGSARIAEVIDNAQAGIAADVLAAAVIPYREQEASYTKEWNINGEQVTFWVNRV
jgi:isoleucyl-tRNA synthetase